MLHITINGRTLCEHTGCVAGMANAQRALGTTRNAICSHRDIAGAYLLATRWKRTFPGHAVAMVLGECPHMEGPHR